MQVLLNTALPFFAVIAVGYLAVRLGYVGEGSAAGINSFVFHVALPALLVDKLGQAPIERLFDPRFIGVFCGASVAVYGLVLLLSRLRGSPLAESALRSLSAVWGNWGFMGIPLLLATFGPEGAIVAILAMLGDIMVTSPLTIALVEVGRSGKGGWAAARGALKNVVRNPLVVATALGCGLAALDLTPPVPAARLLELLGAAATPCALFALGASLVGVPLGSNRRETLEITLCRLVLHPALVYLGAVWWLPLPGSMGPAAVLTAALPTAASAFVLAKHYEIYVMQASTIVLVTHLLSVVTLSALLVRFAG